MADFKFSSFKPMSETYAKVAKSLLSSTGDSYKKDVYKGLGLQVIADGLKGVGANLKQSVLDGANDVKENYSDIFDTNKSEYDSYSSERERLKRYQANPEVFLNEEAAKVIDNTDEAQAARVTWSEVDLQPEDIRKSMYKARNEEREKIQREMERLEADPRVTTRTFNQFNERAVAEYKAALKLVEDDPTKKGLVRNLWNRVFKTERKDGELVTTNETLLKLQSDLNTAKEKRTTFRDSIEDQQIVEGLYTPLEFKNKSIDVGKLYFAGTPALRQAIQNNPEFKNLKDGFFHNAMDIIRNEKPELSQDQIITETYMQMVDGQFDPVEYQTRDQLKLNAGINLIKVWDNYTPAEKRKHIEEDPSRLFKLQDAFVNDKQAERAKGLGVTYKDIFDENKSLAVQPQQKQTYIEVYRGMLNQDKKGNRAALADLPHQANMGTYASITENYFTKNNKDWTKKYDPIQLQTGIVTFLSQNKMTSTRMTEADLIDLRLTDKSTRFNEAILDDTPKMIDELVNADRQEDVIPLRKKYIDSINSNKNLELNEDEKAELINKIDNIFINSGQLDLTEEEIRTGNIYSRTNLTTLQPSLSDVDFNPVPLDGGYYLKNADKLVSEMDLNSLSNGQLLTLRLNTMPGNVGRNSQLPFKLGLPSDISLDSRKTSGLTPLPGLSDLFAKDKVRVQLRNRIEDELDKREYSGPILMASTEGGDFEEIPNSWWNRYRIETPRGVVNTRGLTRGSKYNQPISNQSAVVPEEPVEVKKKSLLSSTEPQEQVTNGLTFAESSNNPDALWKQSQKETFKNFTPTQSTLKEVLEFTEFDGEYADWSRQQGQNKTTHTPVGKYQFVGATLRDIKKRGGLDDLNITDNTIFTEQVQDKLFEWYIKDTIKSVGINATQEDKREKIRTRFEGATTENVSNEELDLIMEQILTGSYSSNINKGQ